MKPCPNCSQEMREGTNFCPHCGFRIAAPAPDGKLLTGSPVGDVIVGIILHSILLGVFNGAVASLMRDFDGMSFLLTPFLSGILYFIVAWRLKYKSLGAGVYWTYIVGIVAVIALVVIIFGICLIGGMNYGH